MPTTHYIQQLRALVARDTGPSPNIAMTLEQRVASVVGAATTTSIPDLQRAIGADARALGSALRVLGFKRRRSWTGEDYALTVWQKQPAA